MQLVEPRPARPIPIRITPLIDVVFILLVFFMLTSRLLPVSFMEVSNSTGDTHSVTGEPIPEVVIQRDGQALWQGETYTIEALTERLRASGVGEINLATDAATQLTDFTQAYSQLSDSGITTHWKRSPQAAAQP
ncbi:MULTISPECIES: biopolymer transporter ExbD [unclassified Marinobacter]|jgi:biopolymer transport protein ExbD|uniref:ExbD/TolR family protein n=1 Tax=unclassified Marinobacter TaxID=83889 RepID=UPI00055E8BD6|nr:MULTISPECIES: biopolymer transporter ExbD [unclassified Marinobacter]MAB54226.1 biopolymer transporter ExbD [Marinobacter sp.]|tara:strand:+ start:690 stop:1091 length:402 start_codon:yes stop_codon:yes gene_type:complete